MQQIAQPSTLEFRLQIVTEFLSALKQNAAISYSQFLQDHYPQIPYRRAYNWLRALRTQVARSLNMSPNEEKGAFGSTANEMSLVDKQRILLETSGLDEEGLGEYCRSHGLYASDVKRWDEEINAVLSSNEGSKGSTIDVKGLKQELHKANKDLAQMGKQLKARDKEIARKDKALAEYAAKVITLENFHKLFANSNEDA